MKIILADLPDHIVSKGKKIKIYTDFQSCLLTIMAFEDNNLTLEEKSRVMCRNILPENITPTEDILKQIVVFLNCGEEFETEEGQTPFRIFSFTHDESYIYSAFRQTHNIDLRKAKLHWWEFVTLFQDLGSETLFNQIVGIRQRVHSGKALEEEKKAYYANPKMFQLEQIDDTTIEEKEAYAYFMKLTAGSMNGG